MCSKDQSVSLKENSSSLLLDKEYEEKRMQEYKSTLSVQADKLNLSDRRSNISTDQPCNPIVAKKFKKLLSSLLQQHDPVMKENKFSFPFPKCSPAEVLPSLM